MIASAPLFAQSKKELRAEVQRLKTEIEQLNKPTEVDLNNKHTKASYAIGVMIATNLESQEMDSLDIEAVVVAFHDVLKDQELKLPRQEAESTIQQYMQEMMDAKKTKAIEEATAYLDNNKKKEGIQETESGLQYKVIKQGSGKSPGPKDRVKVHYTGMLTDGTVFDSSVERGEPITFGVNQVIPGWTEALQLMKEGDKWTIYIPYELAYGERGAGRDIPPYSTLVFDVELLKIE
ncbi:peptidyl-prolyl isomerase [Flammeovirgaceae bacterium 311]|nr:peptidyl-prolyl isomerase [Flammeovirgaceae bacterium 311]